MSSGLPVTSKDTSATDGSGVYGTFYVDLMGNGMKTFNSPGHCARLSQDFLHQQGTETIQIFTQPASKSSSCSSRESLPWKQAIRPQPKMGLLRESREKKINGKQGKRLRYLNMKVFLWAYKLCVNSLKSLPFCHRITCSEQCPRTVQEPGWSLQGLQTETQSHSNRTLWYNNFVLCVTCHLVCKKGTKSRTGPWLYF